MQLAGQPLGLPPMNSSPEVRALAAQLLLSEVLEYVIKGLGVTPSFRGAPISDANGLRYEVLPGNSVNLLEMLDGLSDTAYTMYWNALAFGLPLDEAFSRVCDNNLEKFVRIPADSPIGSGQLGREMWSCGLGVEWPAEVASVEVLTVEGVQYAVGKDQSGKVRKPSSFRSVQLRDLVDERA